jgi:hypothetical protein
VDETVLETGWLPTTPSSDSYLRRFLLNWAAECEAATRMHGGDVQRLDAVVLTDSGRPTGFSNCATLLQPLVAATEADLLARINAFFAFDDPDRTGSVLFFSAWPTEDLRPYGWTLAGHPALHLLPQGKALPPAPPGLRIEEVRDIAGLLAWERVLIDGFPVEELADAPSGAMMPEAWLREERARFWVGWEGDRAVCAASTWVDEGINDVTMVATLPEVRRRGYGEAITWRAALADPSLPAMLFSSDDGRPVYDRMGFLPLHRLTLWYRNRPGDGGRESSVVSRQ